MTNGGWFWFVAFVVLLYVCLEFACRGDELDPFDPNQLEDE